jgi:GAF domain-containing protein
VDGLKIENPVADLERLVTLLVNSAGGESPLSLAAIAERIAKYLGVQNDEVAILAVSTRWRSLQFLVPERLSHVGSIPLSNPNSLAARTARESRPEIVNNFTAMPHASIFEAVPMAGRAPTETIQKIISAPILLGKKVIGVMQVCRKGRTKQSAGPDFTADELGKVLALCSPLGKLLRHFANE